MNNPWRFVPFEDQINRFSIIWQELLLFTIMGGCCSDVAGRKLIKRWHAKTERRNFQKQKQTPVQDKFGLNPWTFVAAFCVLTAGQHSAMLGFYKIFDNCTLFSALAATGVGYLIANTLLQSAVETFKDGPLKMEALKRYHEACRFT